MIPNHQRFWHPLTHLHESSARTLAHACGDDAAMISRPVSVHEILAILRTRDTLGHHASCRGAGSFAQIRNYASSRQRVTLGHPMLKTSSSGQGGQSAH